MWDPTRDAAGPARADVVHFRAGTLLPPSWRSIAVASAAVVQGAASVHSTHDGKTDEGEDHICFLSL